KRVGFGKSQAVSQPSGFGLDCRGRRVDLREHTGRAEQPHFFAGPIPADSSARNASRDGTPAWRAGIRANQNARRSHGTVARRAKGSSIEVQTVIRKTLPASPG